MGASSFFRHFSSVVLLTWPGDTELADVYARARDELPEKLRAALDRTLAEDIAVELPGQAAGQARLRGPLSEDLV